MIAKVTKTASALRRYSASGVPVIWRTEDDWITDGTLWAFRRASVSRIAIDEVAEPPGDEARRARSIERLLEIYTPTEIAIQMEPIVALPREDIPDLVLLADAAATTAVLLDRRAFLLFERLPAKLYIWRTIYGGEILTDAGPIGSVVLKPVDASFPAVQKRLQTAIKLLQGVANARSAPWNRSASSPAR